MSRRVALPFAAVAVLVFAALALLFFYRLAFTDLILARGDTFQYFYPYWDARDSAFRTGELPLWTTELYMGAPLLSNPQLGTLYPPNWLTIPLGAPQSIKISILLHVVWGASGAALLARRAFYLRVIPSLVAGAIFGFSGYVGAHVEQINQLQGIAWMPWLFWLYLLARDRPSVYTPVMGMAWAMQLLSGHTQTAFISGVGLGIFALIDGLLNRRRVTADSTQATGWKPLLSSTGIIIIAVLLGVILALPQLIPTQELISLSNRGGGLSQQEATAFSLHPALIGRGLLPGYKGQPFAEYIGYIGVVGLGLAVLGAASPDRRRWPWLALVIAGFVFALGRYTPVYLLLAGLPGFDLFRVPARWLALVALAGAVLAAKGLQTLRGDDLHDREAFPVQALLMALVLFALLAFNTRFAASAADEVDGPALPTVVHWLAWGVAFLAFLGLHMLRMHGFRRWLPLLALAFVVVELMAASRVLPYNDVTDPAAYERSRFSIDLMRVLTSDQMVPGRLLSISSEQFDPGDKTDLEARWSQMGLNARATRYAFTATKLKEIIAPNLPLTWHIASIDGFGGGVLPTLFYTQFTSLLLPEDTPRTIDGRLREVLAQPTCRGACVPDDALLDLTNTQYLLLDKVFDVVHEGIFYDTALRFPPDAVVENLRQFEADALHVLVDSADMDAEISASFLDDEGEIVPVAAAGEPVALDQGRLVLLRFRADEPVIPATIELDGPVDVTIYALTLVDTRTDAHVQLTPPGWRRVYSADVKIYENLDLFPRAFVVHEALTVPDDYGGSEMALELLQEADLRQTITLHTDQASVETTTTLDQSDASQAMIVEYKPTRIVVDVMAAADGWLFLSDAYYPGWKAVDQNGDERDILRADVMFRAVPVQEGQQTITMTYAPPTISALTMGLGAFLWLLVLAVIVVAIRHRR